ncbi:hypothetical protein H2203_000312 [Taxawa tesnikishii (nom. ined.)]|nr:hypothetical protein H2203_000312 [Dothideales sp. JES 119]
MSSEEYRPSRPLSVMIPKVNGAHGPYCPRRPNLTEILANTSPPPWTLAAFMAYLSNNHCLETLEFTMDAGRYRKHYNKMLSKAPEGGVPPERDCEYVQSLWDRLIEAYIQPNGSREVNLPSEVRDPIVNLSPSPVPPTPETLDPAVAKIYELMEESVLVPFLNSICPQTANPTISSCPYNTSDENVTMSATYDDRSMLARRQRHARSSPPPRVRTVDIQQRILPRSPVNQDQSDQHDVNTGYAHDTVERREHRVGAAINSARPGGRFLQHVIADKRGPHDAAHEPADVGFEPAKQQRQRNMAEEAGPAEWVAAGKEEEPDFPAADVAVADAGGAGARRLPTVRHLGDVRPP